MAMMERNVVKVSGVGKRTVQTTIAIVRLGVEKHRDTASEAQNALATDLTTLIEYLRAQNVNNLQTSGVTLRERQDYSDKYAKVIGYTATNIVTFEVTGERSGPIMDGAVDAGATRIDNVSFMATPEVNAAARQGALTDAITNAKREAKIVTDALGLTLDKAINIQVVDSFNPIPTSPPGMPRGKSFGVMRANTEVISQTSSVGARVAITFETK